MSKYINNFARIVATYPFILTEGAVIERIRRDTTVELDPYVANASLVYTSPGRAALTRIYTQYLDVGNAYNLPMITFTPTWRANSELLRRAGLPDVDTVNGDCARFLQSIRESYDGYAGKILIGGLMGCLGDAYNPADALSIEDATIFHQSQAYALANTGVDFLMGATLPAFSEALGMARAMAETHIPYIMSFVLRPTGTLLDGMPLHRAITRMDADVSPRPFAYWANCVHPSIFASALVHEMTQDTTLLERMIGLQANTSAKSPEELDGLDGLDTEAPETFARAMIALRVQFGVKMLGGCCGTDERHIAEIAKNIVHET
ncbi:MAG: homocysteine S-methyltransferase family protein [Anaerolineae bacterium]|nr:homocysteine S-methyltransferase family protein [Anaerolineae bacterium]